MSRLGTSWDPAADAEASNVPPPGEDDEAAKLLRRWKQALRKQIRSRMKSAYPPFETERLNARSDETFSRLFALPEYRSASSVGLFLSMPSGEIQTRNAVRQVARDGKTLYVPRVGLDFERCDMDLVRCEAAAGSDGHGGDGVMFYDNWPRNKWGIPEPPADAAFTASPGDIDLLLVPGLAFDIHGRRLGQGKGYYDRFIARMRARGDEGNASGRVDGEKPILVGVCLEEQFLKERPHGVELGDGGNGLGRIIPVSDHDYVMDMVLTPSLKLTVPKLKPA